MAKFEDLEAMEEKKKAIEGEVYEEGDDFRQDILDAISLLTRAMHLLSYMGDVETHKVITKPDRGSMQSLSAQIKGYLDAVECHYEDDDEEEA